MFKKFFVSLVAMLAISSLAFAQYPDPDYPDPTPTYGDCEKVADLVDSNVDLEVCKLSRSLTCLALSNGAAIECGLSSRFRYRSGGSYSCDIIASLSSSGGGNYPASGNETIQRCLIGSGRSGVKVLVTVGDISIE